MKSPVFASPPKVKHSARPRSRFEYPLFVSSYFCGFDLQRRSSVYLAASGRRIGAAARLRTVAGGVMKNILRCMLALLVSACAHAETAPVSAGAKYVAMGSSFAAGPGITNSADVPANRCGRSADNYAQQIARRRNLTLTDVSCGGAMTANILGPWNELPAQMDAVDADTRLVTVTIGGNDVGYIGGLFGASCVAQRGDDNARSCPPISEPDDAAFAALEERMAQIPIEVRRRAPSARVVFVDYLSVLPPSGVCEATPLSAAHADLSRAIERRLRETTARAAARGGADVLRASELSAEHSACASAPWMNGFPAPEGGSPYHPNLQGMTAVADALEQLLWP